MYRSLDPARIVETAEALALRVGERFPGAGLARVAAELAETTRQARERCVAIGRPHRGLRVGIALLIGVGLGALAVLALNLEPTEEMWRVENFFSSFNDLVGSAVFLGAAIAFLATLETRRKRARALDAIAELRAIAHVVDMHQLTKDPDTVLGRAPPTAHSPKRSMDAIELGRYYDYCSEMLSVVAKIGALYVEALPDPDAIDAANDLEGLCTGLSRKIWQKAALLDRPLNAGA